ncbi:MAG TPA: tyrosine-type recombinase/integrase [Pyrinomonadaceae bacterium]|nr:tyrosine-type recombinase/integrase [Pyrinomonadaceae bacterium]
MTIQRHKTALVRVRKDHLAALRNAAELWANSTTADGLRKDDLLRDKQQAVTAFFTFVGKQLSDVTPADVSHWLRSLEERGLRPATVYQRACLLSSFYTWAMRDKKLGSLIGSNPVQFARPKAPKAYQSESSKSLTDDELEALISVVKQKAETGDIVGKRDYAILLLFMASGKRRTEILSLRGRDVKVDKTLIINNRIKGGDFVRYEIADPSVKDALLDYLTEARRLNVFRNDAPLWTRHDYAGRPGAALSSHCFVKNLKRYARVAGIEDFHLHRTRHTFARIVSEETGSITATQEALDHRNPSTTRVYVQRIAIKRDLHSERISSRWIKKSRSDTAS